MKKFNKKSLVLLIATALLLTFSVSGTVAYLVDGTNSVENVFTPGSIVPGVDENFDETTKEYVKITNSGTVDAYVRVKVLITWQDAAGNVYPIAPQAGTDYTITWNKVNWTDELDGYYYYTKKVTANGGTTDTLLSNVKQIKAGPKVGENQYYLHVEILAQAIQTEPASALTDANWGWTPTTGTN